MSVTFDVDSIKGIEVFAWSTRKDVVFINIFDKKHEITFSI